MEKRLEKVKSGGVGATVTVLDNEKPFRSHVVCTAE